MKIEIGKLYIAITNHKIAFDFMVGWGEHTIFWLRVGKLLRYVELEMFNKHIFLFNY